MIERLHVMPMLLGACPSFADAWQRHVADQDYDPALLYIDLGLFAQHLVDLMRSKRLSEFERVFDVVERLHTEGDAYVREAATVGLLEGVQNIAGHDPGLDAASFVPWLRPESLSWWNRLNDFWQGNASALREDEP